MSISAPLGSAFYNRDPAIVAPALLGALLRSESPDGTTSGVIVETEAYLGPHDPACHAVAGRTKRTWHLFGEPGIAYVYFIYGMHWCVNAVTKEEGFGSAVLIRALEPVEGLDLMRRRRSRTVGGRALSDRLLCNGPAKICQALALGAVHNGLSLALGPLTILPGAAVPSADIVVDQRIGISKAREWPLRFSLRDNPWVSRPARAV